MFDIDFPQVDLNLVAAVTLALRVFALFMAVKSLEVVIGYFRKR